MKKSNEVFSQKILNFKRFILPQFVLSLFITIGMFSIGQIGSNSYAQENRLRLHFIDVGYGDAIVIQLPDSRTLMIDAGEKLYSSQIIRYLKSLNITKIDQAIITHPHKNHFEGFLDVLKYIPIENLFVNGDQNAEEGYEMLLETFRDRKIPIHTLNRGMMLGGLSETVSIEVLHPENLSSSTNGNSIVLWVKHGQVSILLMADIELEEQAQLIDLYQAIEQVNSIKVPHHGGPLSDEFIEFFSEKDFIISTGANPWGLPYERDIRRLRGTIYRTDHHGSIILESDGVSVSIKTLGIEEI